MPVFLALCVLIAFGLWAPGLPTVLRRIIRSVSAYAVIVFVARPVYLLAVQPAPKPSNPVADPLLLAPTYAAGIENLSHIIFLSQAVFTVAAYIFLLPLAGRFKKLRLDPPDAELTPMLVLYGVSWLCRLGFAAHLASTTGPSVAILRLAPVGTAVAFLLIVCRDWRASPSGRKLVFVIALGEVIWSLIFASKTPLIATAFAFYLDPGRSRFSPRAAAGAVVGTVFSFGVIQKLKPGATTSSATGHGIGSILLSVLGRFDMLHAVAVARLYGPRSYVSPPSALGQMVSSLLPQQLLGVQRLNDGQNWANIMEQASFAVSVSTGPVAEGYAIDGTAGVILSSCMVAAVFALSVILLFRARAFWLPLLAAYLVTSASPFEAGPIGIMQSIGEAFQACLVCFVIVALIPRVPALQVLHPRQDVR